MSCALHSSGKSHPLLPPDPDLLCLTGGAGEAQIPCYCRSADRVTDTVTNLTEKVSKKQGRGLDTIMYAEKGMHLQFLESSELR